MDFPNSGANSIAQDARFRFNGPNYSPARHLQGLVVSHKYVRMEMKPGDSRLELSLNTIRHCDFPGTELPLPSVKGASTTSDSHCGSNVWLLSLQDRQLLEPPSDRPVLPPEIRTKSRTSFSDRFQPYCEPRCFFGDPSPDIGHKGDVPSSR